jgi:uncharacterized phage protein gp47/JayE
MLTKEGFKRKTFIEYLEEMQEQARELFGADVNLSDRSPLGQWIMLIAYGRAQENALAEQIWLSGHIDDAEGVSLDHNAKKIGLSRIQAQKAKGQASFTVDPGASVLSGMIVSTTDGIEFITTSSASAINGIATVNIESILPGIAGNVPANTIVEINTPVAGINAVTNAAATQDGADIESDSEFKERYYRSLANAGGASTPSIEAALLELPGVIDASVDENDQEYVNRGLPPNSIAPFVYGGDDQEIANAIFSRKTGGIRSFGTTEVVLTDSKGKQHKIGFSRPTVVNVWVKLTISKSPEYQQYPVDGDVQVKSRIIEHIGGLDTNGTKYDGQGLDADVIHYKLIAAIADIPGINDVMVELSTDGINYNQNNIAINNVSIAQTDHAKVVIQ